MCYVDKTVYKFVNGIKELMKVLVFICMSAILSNMIAAKHVNRMPNC